jgi:hypothetical protein
VILEEYFSKSVVICGFNFCFVAAPRRSPRLFPHETGLNFKEYEFKYVEPYGISGFLDFIHRPVFEGTRRFGKWICFRPQVKGGKKTPTQLGPLERRKQIQFPKRRVPSNIGRWIKSRKPEISCVIHHRHNPSETT